VHTVAVEVPPLGAGRVEIPLEGLAEGVRAALSRMVRVVVIVPELAEPPEELAAFLRRKGGRSLLGCAIYDDKGNPVALHALLLRGKHVESYIDAGSEDAARAAGLVVLAVMSFAATSLEHGGRQTRAGSQRH
jgi:hypothetical protein